MEHAKVGLCFRERNNMEAPVKVERYGQEVWETKKMSGLRKEHCMCYHCGSMKPGEVDHCQIAQAFYEICKKHGNAFILTRCGSWTVKE